MEHYKVYDKNGRLLVSDIVRAIKSDVGEVILKEGESNSGDIIKVDLISFDTKHFLNKTHFKCELIKDSIKDVDKYRFDKVEFDINNFSNYRVAKWHDITRDFDAPIYRDFGYDELDPEVAELVHVLNSIPSIITTGSCSGHDSKSLFVAMSILDYDTILFLTNIINTYFHKDFRLTTDEIVYQESFRKTIFIDLVSTSIGETAYSNAKKLVKVIEENKNNIYIKFDNQRINYDGMRVQVFDTDGDLLVDDVVNRTRRLASDQNYNYGYINKRVITNKCYISFDGKYYFDINSRVFKFNVLNHIASAELHNFKDIKFDINNFKKYSIEDFATAELSNAPIFINNEPN